MNQTIATMIPCKKIEVKLFYIPLTIAVNQVGWKYNEAHPFNKGCREERVRRRQFPKCAKCQI